MSDKSSSTQSPCPPEGNPARRAKIICTIGPSCGTEPALRELMQLGMDVARLNFSHGSHADHARSIKSLRHAATEEGRTICILQDLQGPKIRTGMLKDHHPVVLKAGDMVAISFVRSAADVRSVKKIIASHKQDVPVIAKLEKPQALEQLEEILEVADGVMVARGDLGVEMPPEKVPVIQKHVIRRAAEWRKPVIIATQMLESMIENPRPTRAEASDVANAVFDGTDAVMLSAETASGRYPREAVAMMSRIIIEAESNMDEFMQPRRRREHRGLSISETICESIAHAAEDLHMGAIAVFTETGNTARMISKYRPRTTIYAFSRARICSRMNLLWGVH